MKSSKLVALLALALSLGMLLSLVPATSGAFAQSAAQIPMKTAVPSAMPAARIPLPAITLPKKVSLKISQKINRLNIVVAPRFSQKINRLNIIKPRFTLNIHRLNVIAPRAMMKANRWAMAKPMMRRSGWGRVNLINKVEKSSQIVASHSVNIIVNIKNLILARSITVNRNR